LIELLAAAAVSALVFKLARRVSCEDTARACSLVVVLAAMSAGMRVPWSASVTLVWVITVAWLVAVALLLEMLAERPVAVPGAVAAIAFAALAVPGPSSADQARIVLWVVALPGIVVLTQGRLSVPGAALLAAAGATIGLCFTHAEPRWSTAAVAVMSLTAVALWRIRIWSNAPRLHPLPEPAAFVDAAAAIAAYYLAFRLKYEGVSFVGHFAMLERTLPIVVAMLLVARRLTRHLIPASIVTVAAIALLSAWSFVRPAVPFTTLVIFGLTIVPVTWLFDAAADALRRWTTSIRDDRHELGLELLAASGAFAAVSVFSAHLQQFTPVPFADAEEYLDMTRQYEAGARIVHASAPFVYRVATPWLASLGSYYLVNIAAALAATLLLVVWLRRHVETRFARLFTIVLFLATWIGPARFVYFTPVYVDPLFIALSMAGVLLVDATRDWLAMRAGWLVAALVFVGTFSRETMVLVALAFAALHTPWTARARWRFRDAIAAVIPFVAAAAAELIVRRLAMPTETYSAAGQLLTLARQKPFFTWVLSWFFVFGPGVVALIAIDGRRSAAWLRSRPHLVAFLAGCGMLAFVGGTDTERITLWSAPVVYALAGRAIDHCRRVWTKPALALVLGAAQLVSSRLLWPVPSNGYVVTEFAGEAGRGQVLDLINRLVVIDTHYGNLWSYWGSRTWHAIVLAYDLVFVAIVVWFARDMMKSASAPKELR
jgi:hypothetical protein